MEADLKTVAARARHGAPVLLILAVLLAFASISTDLFLPALPTMQVALGASEGTLSFTISGYLLGFGFGQLFWGPISDRYGRRPPLALGVVVFAIGSAGCALSTDATQIIAWRFVQALGASAGVALARAMIRDLYERNDAARVLSMLMLVMAIAPLLGPSVGAQIMAVSSWRAIFWTLVGIGAATCIPIALILPESLPPDRREHGSLWTILSGYGALLSNRSLMAYAGAIGFFYFGLFANIAGGPFAFIRFHHLSPTIDGVVFSSGVVGLMIANLLNARLVKVVGSDRMLLVGCAGAAVFGVAQWLVSITNFEGVYGLIGAQFLFGSMNGLILANSVAGALSSVRTRAGAASAVVGAIQYGSGMLGTAVLGVLANGTPVPMSAVTAVGGVGSFACALLAARQRG